MLKHIRQVFIFAIILGTISVAQGAFGAPTLTRLLPASADDDVTLNDVYALDANTIYACGNSGTLLKITNSSGTYTITKLTTSTTSNLHAVWAHTVSGTNYVYAVGDSIILKATGDNVVTETIQNVTTPKLYDAFGFTNSDGNMIVVAVGASGKVIMKKSATQANSPNASWVDVSPTLNPAPDFYSVAGHNSTTTFYAWIGGTNRSLYRYSGTGAEANISWSAVDQTGTALSATDTIYGATAISSTTLYLSGTGARTVRTFNADSVPTWTNIDPGATLGLGNVLSMDSKRSGDNDIVAVVGSFDSVNGITTFSRSANGNASPGNPTWTTASIDASMSINGVSIVNDGGTYKAYAVGENRTILVFDGTTVTAVNSGRKLYRDFMRVAAVPSSGTVYAVGGDGQMMKYDGTTVTSISTGTTELLNSISIASSTDLLIVGTNKLAKRTTDGGTNWSTIDLSALTGFTALYEVVRSGATAVLTADSGRVVLSTNTLGTWSVVQPGGAGYTGALFAAEIKDVNTVMVGGQTGQAYLTKNAGTTWQSITVGGSTMSINGIAYSSSEDAWIVVGASSGASKIYQVLNTDGSVTEIPHGLGGSKFIAANVYDKNHMYVTSHDFIGVSNSGIGGPWTKVNTNLSTDYNGVAVALDTADWKFKGVIVADKGLVETVSLSTRLRHTNTATTMNAGAQHQFTLRWEDTDSTSLLLFPAKTINVGGGGSGKFFSSQQKDPASAKGVTSLNLAANTNDLSIYYYNRKAESNTVTASFDSLSASQALTVNGGAYAKLLVVLPGETHDPGSTTTGLTGTPSSVTAGTSFNATVTAVDDYFNTVSTVTNSVSLASSDTNAVLPAAAALASGTKTFAVTLKTSGARNVMATDATASFSKKSSEVTVNAAAASMVAYETKPLSVTAGQNSSTITVAVQDQFGGNASGTYTVNLTSSSTTGEFRQTGSDTKITSVSIVGAATGQFRYTDTKSGSPTLTAAVSGLTSGTLAATVNAAAATKLVLTQKVASTTANDVETFILQKQDAFGNAVIGALDVTITSSSSKLLLGTINSDVTKVSPMTLSFGASDSQKTFYVKANDAGSFTLTVSATGLTQDSVSIAATASTGSLSFTNPPISAAAGERKAVSFYRSTTTDTNTVSLVGSTSAVKFYASASSTTAITSLGIGVGEASQLSPGTFFVEAGTPGSYTYRITATGLSAAESNFTVSSGSYASFTTSGLQPSYKVGDDSIVGSILFKDAQGNTTTAGLPSTIKLSVITGAAQFRAFADTSFSAAPHTLQVGGASEVKFGMKMPLSGSTVTIQAEAGSSTGIASIALTSNLGIRVAVVNAVALKANETSEVTLQLRDKNNTAISTVGDLTVNLATSTEYGEWRSAAGSAITQITIPAGGSGVTGYYYITIQQSNVALTTSSSMIASDTYLANATIQGEPIDVIVDRVQVFTASTTPSSVLETTGGYITSEQKLKVTALSRLGTTVDSVKVTIDGTDMTPASLSSVEPSVKEAPSKSVNVTAPKLVSGAHTIVVEAVAGAIRRTVTYTTFVAGEKEALIKPMTTIAGPTVEKLQEMIQKGEKPTVIVEQGQEATIFFDLKNYVANGEVWIYGDLGQPSPTRVLPFSGGPGVVKLQFIPYGIPTKVSPYKIMENGQMISDPREPLFLILR